MVTKTNLLDNLSTLRIALNLSYNNLLGKTQESQERQQLVQTERAILARERNEIILQHGAYPKALGANEAAREAKLLELTSIQSEIVGGAEALLRDAQNAECLAALEVEQLRTELRVLEASVSLLTLQES